MAVGHRWRLGRDLHRIDVHWPSRFGCGAVRRPPRRAPRPDHGAPTRRNEGGGCRIVRALVTALDHFHWFAIFLATAALGLFILALAAAVRVTDALPRWVASTGFVAGAVQIAAVPGARVGLVDVATLVWLVWFVAFGVAALRRGRNSVSVLSQASARV